MHRADTIVAVATAGGRAGIGVVRLSGPSVRQIATQICSRALSPRHATLVSFLAPDRRALDQGIAILFESPHSYTGEDVLELHGHGGTAVLRLLMQRCVDLGARPAEPGEFTKRTFLNGKLDLVQAESVADLIDASSAAAVRSAMQSLSGAFSEQIEALAAELLEIRARVEAVLDFPEEEIDAVANANLMDRVGRIRVRLRNLLNEAAQGSLLREGTRAVLVGRPNVGKSSLMNRLAREEVAIVTDVPGTTRDALRYELVIEGVPVHVVDTAGLRTGGDQVERLGIKRTIAEVAKADIAILVVEGLTDDSKYSLSELAIVSESTKVLRVINKIDLFDQKPQSVRQNGDISVWVSAKTGEGIELLRQAILELAGWQSQEEAPFMARERHLLALQDADKALHAAQEVAGRLELFAEELRLAHMALGRITGETSADELLGEIFSRFCIGK